LDRYSASKAQTASYIHVDQNCSASLDECLIVRIPWERFQRFQLTKKIVPPLRVGKYIYDVTSIQIFLSRSGKC
ncbi:hypothetical protein PENTCL1PPCAC_19110, partial [Pristionchus entomophagus]